MNVKTSISMYVDGNRNLSEEKFYWNNEMGEHYGIAVNSADSWSNNYWREGEPTIVYKGVPECYMSIEYEKTRKQWRFNDMVNGLASKNKSTVGHIGFICEY